MIFFWYALLIFLETEARDLPSPAAWVVGAFCVLFGQSVGNTYCFKEKTTRERTHELLGLIRSVIIKSNGYFGHY